MNSTEKGVTFLRRILTGGHNHYSMEVTSLRYTGSDFPSKNRRFGDFRIDCTMHVYVYKQVGLDDRICSN
jgi:hypothetical protein